MQATPVPPSLRFPAPLFVTALHLRLGLPHPCVATYAACSCGHLRTHLLRSARRGERTSSHDSVRDAVYHIIRESRQHAHWERTGFLPSSAPGRRGERVDIVISDAVVGHTLVDIVVFLLQTLSVANWWSAPLDMILSLPQMRSEGRKPTIGIARLGQNLCPLLLRRTVHCQIGRIVFWSSVPL